MWTATCVHRGQARHWTRLVHASNNCCNLCTGPGRINTANTHPSSIQGCCKLNERGAVAENCLKQCCSSEHHPMWSESGCNTPKWNHCSFVITQLHNSCSTEHCSQPKSQQNRIMICIHPLGTKSGAHASFIFSTHTPPPPINTHHTHTFPFPKTSNCPCYLA